MKRNVLFLFHCFFLLFFLVSCGSSGGTEDAIAGSDNLNSEQPVEGTPCNDPDPCTHSDEYKNGICTGIAYTCPATLPFCVKTLACDGNGGCDASVEKGYCYIGGSCFSGGGKNSLNSCEECETSESQVKWTKMDGTTCNDGNMCTKNDMCMAGTCTGIVINCDDNKQCTKDFCDSKSGCLHENIEGECSDGDECTAGDHCENGICIPGKDQLKCDDGNPCTFDFCDKKNGCVYEGDFKKACDDNNPCTDELCDPENGCSHKNNSSSCSDSNACTLDDFCKDGKCESGTGKLDCTDNNICTDEYCDPLKGCIYTYVKGECSDGFDCTDDDFCLGGICIGVKTYSCPDCSIVFSETAAKLTVLQLGNSGTIGQGFDIDDNPDTCAPAGSCSDGIDNELGQLAFAVNSALQDAIIAGSTIYLAEFVNFKENGETFQLNIYYGDLSLENKDCNFQSDTCKYVISSSSMDPACKSLVHFDNAKVSGGKLTAGGAKSIFPINAYIAGGNKIELVIYNARVEGAIALKPDGKTVSSIEGLIGGAVNKVELFDMLDALPDDFFPYNKDDVLSLLDTVIVNDIDVDGNGEKDAASIGIRFSAIPAVLTGVY